MAIYTRTLANSLLFGEGPRWRDERLWISDMFARRVITIDLRGRIEEVVKVPERPSGLGWLPDGRLVIVSMNDNRLLVLENNNLETYANLGDFCGGPSNDMVIDAHGRAYVGNFGFDFPSEKEPEPTNLILVKNGRAEVVADDLLFPNGIAISADGRTMIVAESYAYRLTAFDVDPLSGSLSNRRIFADLGNGSPDGICIDAEGAVWVASYTTCEFIRVLDGGEITHRIGSGDRCAVACTTGGRDRKTLFMLSAMIDDNGFTTGKSECLVETAKIEVPGAGLP